MDIKRVAVQRMIFAYYVGIITRDLGHVDEAFTNLYEVFGLGLRTKELIALDRACCERAIALFSMDGGKA